MQGILFKISILFLLIISLSACTGRTDYAPISEVNTIDPIPKNGIYHVGAGDTLYSIAWRYGLDYRDLARRNQLTPPFHVQKGQIIYLTHYAPSQNEKELTQSKPLTQTINKPITRAAIPRVKNKSAPVVSPSIQEQEPTKTVSIWRWPARGPVIGRFSSTNKGINIGGNLGEPIFTTAPGKVVYSGHGLRGYGNLIIIKHNSKFLSAYAHNRNLLVKEGDWVKSGQKIAEMGNTGTRRVQLHFEIRRNGQPVNPLMYLTVKG